MEIRREPPRVNEAAEEHGIGRSGEPQKTRELLGLLQRVEGEYHEMPGLSLTASQAGRLWGLDRGTCAFILTTLVERRVLRQAPNGTYLLWS